MLEFETAAILGRFVANCSACDGRRHVKDGPPLAFRAIVKRGPPPGLLAFEGDVAVGWCQLTPRADLPHLDRARFTRQVDAAPVWAISCFYVRRGHRKQGVTDALIKEALKVAKRAGAPALEAYPMDTEEPTSTPSLYTGIASTFARAGFKTIARPAPHRPTMRHDLKGIRIGR